MLSSMKRFLVALAERLFAALTPRPRAEVYIYADTDRRLRLRSRRR